MESSSLVRVTEKKDPFRAHSGRSAPGKSPTIAKLSGRRDSWKRRRERFIVLKQTPRHLVAVSDETAGGYCKNKSQRLQFRGCIHPLLRACVHCKRQTSFRRGTAGPNPILLPVQTLDGLAKCAMRQIEGGAPEELKCKQVTRFRSPRVRSLERQ